jgi:maltose alpha-D-glucosyltransferase/alpha-amylase
MSQPTLNRSRGATVALALLCTAGIALAAGWWHGTAQDAPAEGEAYLRWLEERSMLYQAGRSALGVSGQGLQWQHPFAEPQPRAAVRHGSAWLLDYPGSVIPAPGRSVIATWGDPRLWDLLRELGIDVLHTGPVKRAGGIEGKKYTPTVDGWFDPISLDLDPALGTEEEYARMVAVAAERDGSIAGDLVPLHTGTGPDFQLALRAYKDYPGMYTLVEIDPKDWGLLPEVNGPWAVAHVPRPAAQELTRRGYLPGLINSNDAAKEAKSWSGWSATGVVRGADGKDRRWVYLHYFKQTQPTLNWLDPSFAGPRAIAGDVVRNIRGRGTRVLRLDAVPFLGIEPKKGTTDTVHFMHPLSVTGTDTLAFLIRKLGGWSFHELNVPLEELKKFTRHGPDLSYDFFTRAQYLHALLTGDAAPLRLSFRWLLTAGIQPVALVHDLQNHDEITYQLVEPEHRKDQVLAVGGEKLTGKQLRDRMLQQMRAKVAGPAAPYNKLYRPAQDGVATTFAGFIAPALGVTDPYHASPAEVRLIRRGHLLLATANALQPGVFSLSSWDLVGALPVPEAAVKQWVADGDYRWVNRGGVDLLGANPEATTSAFAIPRAQALYGPLPQQLKDPDSFASRLRGLLAARRKARIAEGELIAVPEPKHTALCVLVLRLPDEPLAVTVLNFSREDVDEELDVADWVKGIGDAGDRAWRELLGGERVPGPDVGRLRLRMPALSGTTLILARPAGQ